MIPYVLKIQGVRDYPPTRVTLGEADEHVLITGPNGVGKSTLTFCIGAILRSAKVDIEGLRSSNLQENEPWNAKLTLIFKNEGATRIDAPAIIAFELVIHQAVKSGLIQKEYRILSGEAEDELKNITVYTSGNTSGRNFAAYKEDLQIKYKIDPDLYHLVWYQQEVNQFAAMNPEERFRQFSNMFNITDMQKEWESALESVKEVEQEIKHLHSIVTVAKSNLMVAENERDAYLSNRRRLIENGRKHYTYTFVLLQKYRHELDITRDLLKKLNEKNQETLEKQRVNLEEQKKIEEYIEELKAISSNVGKQLERKKEELGKYVEKEKALQTAYNQLEEQLLEISDKAKRLRYDEQTTYEKLAETEELLEKLRQEHEQLKQKEQKLKSAEREMNKKVAAIKEKLINLQTELEVARKDVQLYQSSSYIQNRINEANKKHHKLFEESQSLVPKITETEKIIHQLQQNQVRSVRQQQGLHDLQRKGIEAYTLRDLIELASDAPLKLEEKIEPIKYAIFYNAASYKPPNDLYYVSLKLLVPSKMIVNLPQLGLQMRSGLTEKLQNYANKVLWWIEQFFISAPKIEGNILIDDRGSRGAQEKLQYILSDAAIQQMLQKQITTLKSLQERQIELKNESEQNEKIINELHGNLRTIQHTESVLLNEAKLKGYETELVQLEEQLSTIYDQQNDVEIHLEERMNERVYQGRELEELKKESSIYEELGAVAEQQLKLQNMEESLREIKQMIRDVKNERDQFTTELEEKEGEIRQQNMNLSNKETEINVTNGELTSYELGIVKAKEKMEQLEADKMSQTIKMKELENILPKEACEIDESISIDWSKTKLIADNAHVAAAFEAARTEKVNVNAEKNYETMKEDYERKNGELARAEILLEKNKNRASETEDQLETTINMYLTKINLLFQKYMDIFNFEGFIEKSRLEEKSGRIKYLLYVKVRKIGHQGSMTDVSLKARNGKVGKGVSGGEESLSSLLFALALLQNLSISPSYIVLDEFDSALDDERKDKVFQLYAKELRRKLIILSPKAHDPSYYNYFSKVFIIEHNSSIPQSNIVGIQKAEYRIK